MVVIVPTTFARTVVVDIDMTVLVVVADVRQKQLHADYTTLQTKYTTAAGAIEQDGAAGGDETEVDIGVGVI